MEARALSTRAITHHFERFAECNFWFHAVLSWNDCGVRIVFEIAIPRLTDG
jgi:hypothetical protein